MASLTRLGSRALMNQYRKAKFLVQRCLQLNLNRKLINNGVAEYFTLTGTFSQIKIISYCFLKFADAFVKGSGQQTTQYWRYSEVGITFLDTNSY